MIRRTFLAIATGGAAALSASCTSTRERQTSGWSQPPPFELDELTVSDLADGLGKGRWTSARLTELYSLRIKSLDRDGPRLGAVIEMNPDAAADAVQLDSERKSGRLRGPLHGIPILIKDNIDTRGNMSTSAGSLALERWHAPEDAFVAARLRAAGAILLGKTNLSEWANWRSTHSISGWSGRGGQARCPYALDRSPSGSSSGSGVAAATNLCAASCRGQPG